MTRAIPFIRVAADPLDAEALRTALTDTQAGALVLFEGRARDHHEGRAVLKLSYEAYAPMAEKELERLRQEAITRFGLLDCAVHHRTGEVPLTEAAVIVATSSAHRVEAFQAAAWVMDEIKASVPIWKRETYEDGSEAWVECHHRHTKLS
ncbi:MAG TPA: molybdenum cofactor biosynthesis protein MoaE [Holophagaceae bacterium]|jgi:molybdopterin synthase catalytic subunit|nr:molybdenum cofactor biosynthesis protein MoaE [Holophagaceae bacterium]